MPRVCCLKSVPIHRSPRVMQLEGLFDLKVAAHSQERWSAWLPLESRDWRIGLIVGPSGCGKTTLARELFGEKYQTAWAWPTDRAIVDAFPAGMSIHEITGLLSSVGFSSPPGWLKPFRVLSNGEQFRVNVARALADRPDLVVIDEFTSVVDRTVAQIASAAIAKTIRREKTRFVAVACHYDVEDWLQPDWTYDPAADRFTWRLLQPRPPIELTIRRVARPLWRLFRPHHYLTGSLHRSATCFAAFLDGRPVAFTAVLSHPDSHGGYWREHRTVCLPDFQGVGIGSATSEFVAGLYRASGKRYFSVTSHPAMIAHRLRSPHWRLYRAPSFSARNLGREQSFNRTAALCRKTVGFQYVGPANVDLAVKFGVVGKEGR